MANLKELEEFTIPSMRQDAVVVAARRWPDLPINLADDRAVIHTLDRFMTDQLPAIFQNDVSMLWAGAEGEGRISNEGPTREDFDSDDMFAAAERLWDEYRFWPSPWTRRTDLDSEIHDTIQQLIPTCINDRSYRVVDVDGKISEMAFSRDEAEKLQIVELEKECLKACEVFTENIVKSFDGPVRCFLTDSVLDDAEKFGWICYWDQVLAIAGREHFVMLYAGYESYWG